MLQLRNAYIAKKADEIFIPCTNIIETQLFWLKMPFLNRKTDLVEELSNTKSSEIRINEAMTEMSKNITFLRSECSSKNEIIKILLDDQITTNTKHPVILILKRLVNHPLTTNNSILRQLTDSIT